MFTKLIRGILGGLGLIKKDLKFKKTDVNDFLRSIKRGSIILTRDRTPNFIQGGISGATNSAWQHALLYFGKSNGRKGLLHEIVEAQGEGVIVSQLDKNFNDDTQMIAFTFNLTDTEFQIIKDRAYSQVGKPYDYAEFISHLLPLIPNPDDLFVCSSLATYAYRDIKRIVKKNVDWRKATPGDIFNGCYPQVFFCSASRFNF